MSKQSRLVWIVTVGLVLLAGNSGCALWFDTPELPLPDVSRDVQYNDIPVPFAFEFDNKRSWMYRKFEDGAMPFRSAELIYWGDRPVRHLAAWYEDQMPKHRWKHERTLNTNGMQLVFKKGIEVAEINLERTIAHNARDRITKVSCRIRAD
ncbi:MAG: hypothetical protein AAF581_19890 [Planctomycetota bacterium]